MSLSSDSVSRNGQRKCQSERLVMIWDSGLEPWFCGRPTADSSSATRQLVDGTVVRGSGSRSLRLPEATSHQDHAPLASLVLVNGGRQHLAASIHRGVAGVFAAGRYALMTWPSLSPTPQNGGNHLRFPGFPAVRTGTKHSPASIMRLNESAATQRVGFSPTCVMDLMYLWPIRRTSA